jgi:hypothetical protein
VPKKPKEVFKTELWELIRRHIGDPKREEGYWPIPDALDEVVRELDAEIDRRFPVNKKSNKDDDAA